MPDDQPACSDSKPSSDTPPRDGEEAAHFFEHTLGLELGAEDAGMRFYQLGDGTTLMVDATGRAAGDPPYMLFSTADVVAAAEYFLERGCAVKELPWATGAGFIASTPGGPHRRRHRRRRAVRFVKPGDRPAYVN